MSGILYLVLWAAVFFVMMRFGCGSHASGHGHGKTNQIGDAHGSDAASENLRWIPPPKDVDPVCGKSVGTDHAKSSVFDGTVYYFCSRDCREIFEAAPDEYVGAKSKEPRPQLEHQHV